jgi:hypothetical protein
MLPIVLGALMSVSACSGATSRDKPDPQVVDDPTFSTTFTRIAESGYVDMSLDFDNPTDVPVTLEGRLVARDSGGAVLPDVEVTTAFGTESGRAVLMPGESTDVVQLDGPGEEEVRAITWESPEVTTLEVSRDTEYVDLQPLGGDGRETDYDRVARQVELRNPGPVPARVRVVLLVLRAPEDGVPQEAVLVHDASTVQAKASGTTVVDLDPRTRRILRTSPLGTFLTLRPVLAP